MKALLEIMRKDISSRATFCLCLLVFAARAVIAQGTAFTYQGQLQNNGNPAGGTYDFIFSLYSVNSGGSPVAGPLTTRAGRCEGSTVSPGQSTSARSTTLRSSRAFPGHW